MQLTDLATPALVVDLPVLDANIARMQTGCAQSGVDLRPHAKTHKCLRIAHKQMATGAIGLTVAKTSEAEVFWEVSGHNILVANEVVAPDRIRRLFTLAQSGTVGVLIDSTAGLTRLAAEATNWQRGLDIYLDVNITDPTGATGRCGLPPGPAAVELARRAASQPKLHFRGIMGYRGVPFLFAPTPPPAGVTVESCGRQEAEMLIAFANELRQTGIPVERILAGSTATALPAAKVSGISEVHPGEYVFYGGLHAGPGVCTTADCALWVLAMVISVPHPGRAVIDAGKKALSGDTNPALHPNLGLRGFGIVQRPDGEPIRDAVLSGLSEEHGVITLAPGADTLQVGDLVQVIPNHVCPVVNLFDYMWVHAGGQVVDKWQVAARGAVE